MTCSVAGGRIMPSWPLLIPNCRWSIVVVASTSSPSSTCSHGRVELERHDLARRFEVALDVEHPVACMADASRREAHLGVLGDAEEVVRAQVLVPRPVPGVEAVGVDRQLDLRAVRTDLVPAVEAVEAAANGGQAPERLDGEVDGGLVAVDGPARRRSRPLLGL